MSEHEVYIFESDPKRVVSVTVKELQRLCRELYADGSCDRGLGLIDGDDMSESLSELVTIHERTCHFYYVDMTNYDVGPNFVEPDVEWRCSACGEAPDVGTQEQIDSLMADYYPSAIPEAIPVCPICGARVVGE